ncbi:hypothetical protein C5D09_06405 [Rathayibacter sp. AY1C9]|uniref:M23 family metallopeptidase n=1 Tax=Rathayibacter sp. AY1C9 TaxID=2080541 RepID=UPI000CE7B71F|nr:M23 family metallopeptidase [Rathayibacter sp. AY1C9]PPH47007.1 hypothetical protein C5D09_06405 [Rathayibacter sp. AY1C9]
MQIIHGARGRITTHFHEDIGRGFLHRGIDLGHGDGTPDDLAVYAPATGIVVAAGRDGTYGNRLIINHGNGWTSLLAHLAAYTVRPGSQVHRGDLIATMGNTGTVFVHLHQELREHGQWVDPELHLHPEQDEIDMLSPEDRTLQTELRDELRGFSQRIDAAGGIGELFRLLQDGLDEIESAADRRAGDLAKVITREGKGARAYVHADTGEVRVMSAVGKWWLPVAADGAEATVTRLCDRGICQSWWDRKTLSPEDFDQWGREFDRLQSGPIFAAAVTA